MRLLLIAVVAAATLWASYWWLGSRAVETGIRGWLDGRADVGWVANHASIRTRGFPNRFDTTINDLQIADPAKGVAWSAPLFQLLRLSYRPNHVIAAWPGEQIITTPEGQLTINASRARASLVFKPRADTELDRATAVFEDVRLESSAGWAAEAAESRFAVHAVENVEHAAKLGIEAGEIRLARRGTDRLATAGGRPEALASMKLDAVLTFDSAWNRGNFENRRPNLTAVELNQLNASWGQLELRADGDLTVDTAGLASGSVNLKVTDWQEMLLVAAAEGWLSDSQLSFLETGLGFLAAFSGSSGILEVPLTLRRGNVNIGPIPLGTIGPLRIQ